LTHPGWGDVVNYFHARDMKYRTAELKLPAVVKPQIDITAATPSLTTFGKLMQTLDIIRGQSRKLAVTSGAGSRKMRLLPENPQLHEFILGLSPDEAPDSTPNLDPQPVEPVNFHRSIQHT